MKKTTSSRLAGFTLVEMLVTVAIIGILATLLLPVLVTMKTKAKVAQAKLEMANIENAIIAYETQYGRMPSSKKAAEASSPAIPDFTFGTKDTSTSPTPAPTLVVNGTGATYDTNNSEVISILMDTTNLRDGANTPTVNANHARNPQKIRFLDAKESNGGPANPLPGVGIDGVYRDPWGTPYIITMDMNYDGSCLDAFYRLQVVSQESGATGRNGLYNSVNTTGASDDFALRKKVMVWSFGPDKDIVFGSASNMHTNKDNVLSWK